MGVLYFILTLITSSVSNTISRQCHIFSCFPIWYLRNSPLPELFKVFCLLCSWIGVSFCGSLIPPYNAMTFGKFFFPLSLFSQLLYRGLFTAFSDCLEEVVHQHSDLWRQTQSAPGLVLKKYVP